VKRIAEVIDKPAGEMSADDIDNLFIIVRQLADKCVIHAAVMGMDFKTDAQKIKKATFNTLRRAREQKISTVALPALGTGVGGFPYLESAQVMLGETKKFLKNNPASFKRITFVLYGDAAFKAFQEVFQASLN